MLLLWILSAVACLDPLLEPENDHLNHISVETTASICRRQVTTRRKRQVSAEFGSQSTIDTLEGLGNSSSEEALDQTGNVTEVEPSNMGSLKQTDNSITEPKVDDSDSLQQNERKSVSKQADKDQQPLEEEETEIPEPARPAENVEKVAFIVIPSLLGLALVIRAGMKCRKSALKTEKLKHPEYPKESV